MSVDVILRLNKVSSKLTLLHPSRLMLCQRHFKMNIFFEFGVQIMKKGPKLNLLLLCSNNMFLKEMHNHQGCEIPLKNVCVCNICDLTISPRVCTAAADCCKSFVDWLINCRPEMGLQLELTGGVFLILVTARKKRINLLFMCTICSGTQKVLLCVRIYKNKLK